VPVVAGVDGCRGGWVAVLVDPATGHATASTHPDAKTLFRALRGCRMSVIDIPIGLPEFGARACDRAARKMLAPHRHTSVFSAPIRPVLSAPTYAGACAVRRRVEGRAMSKQAWNILPRIVEVDRRIVRPRGQLTTQVQFKSGVDWFDLEVGFQLVLGALRTLRDEEIEGGLRGLDGEARVRELTRAWLAYLGADGPLSEDEPEQVDFFDVWG